MSLFSEQLKKCRKTDNKLQKDVAEYLNIATRNYQKYEAGTFEPSIEKINQLADYFDIPVDFLLGRGIFKDWDLIISYKDRIISDFEEYSRSIIDNYNISLKNLSEKNLMLVLPAMIDSIALVDDHLEYNMKF